MHLPLLKTTTGNAKRGEKHHTALLLLVFLPLFSITITTKEIAALLRAQREVYPAEHAFQPSRRVMETDKETEQSDEITVREKGTEQFDASNVKSLRTAVPDEIDKTTRIVGFSDSGYKEIAWKWYQELEKLGYTEHFVGAQDRISGDYFKEKGMRYDLVFPGSNSSLRDECTELQPDQTYRRSLFATRWNYVAKLLEQGHHVLLTDVDNVFVRHLPLSQLEELPYDTQHAYAGTVPSFPINIFRKQGFTICGGMSWLRSTPSVIELVHDLLDRCGCREMGCTCHCDDQVVINNFYFKGSSHEVTWDEPLTVPKSTESMRWEGRTGICKKTGHRVKIWDRNLAYRALSNEPQCPDESNWIAMPSGFDRMTVWESWKAKCPNNRTTGAVHPAEHAVADQPATVSVMKN